MRKIAPFVAFALCALTLVFSCKKAIVVDDTDDKPKEVATTLELTSEASVVFPIEGGNAAITFTTNSSWTAASSASWLTVSPSSGNASEGAITVTATAGENKSHDELTATVTIKADKLEKTVAFTQDAVPPFDPIASPLTLEATKDCEINIKNRWGSSEKTILYAKNSTKLADATSGVASKESTITITLSAGDYVCFFGDNAWYATNDYNYINFIPSEDCYIYGNIMSLVDSDGFPTATTLTDPGTFEYMFRGSKIINHPENKLVLPATTLTESCYVGMFHQCTGLTEAPDLPATELPNYCYNSMFDACTSLTSAPIISANTVGIGSCAYMFQNCTALVTPPALPATTLSRSCYNYMFNGCTSLTSAPELPATILAQSCYQYMFQNCTSLTSTPTLPATDLFPYCYEYMFANCTSLASAANLPATTAVQDCYANMFQNCTSLTTAPTISATTLATSCFMNMFKGCTALTTPPTLPATTMASYCYNKMFSGCTSLATAPALPAETLAEYCYSRMFESCTSLTSAPDLPAASLVSNCYDYMFIYCSNLNYVRCLAVSASKIKFSSWLSGVATTGTFVKKEGVNYYSGDNGIPSGWTVQEE